MQKAITTLVLSVSLLLAGCSTSDTNESEPSSTETSSTTSEQPTGGTASDAPTPAGCGAETESLCLDPAVVPATVGPVEIVVTGTRWDGFTEVAVWICPPAESGSGVPALGCVGDVAQAREDGRLVNNLNVQDGDFSTPLRVELDQAMIDAGELVVAAGDMFIPTAGAVTLQIGD